uniref:Ig-like domain-containing protein n=1 Tax=Cyprinus carpio TaxID=7962 RepID=A0A8C1I509_CYPCA
MNMFLSVSFIILLILSLHWDRGSVFSTKVHQSPPDLFKMKGDDAELECQHSISSNNVILWYKQTPGQGLILLGHLMMRIGQKEDDFTGKVELKGDATKSGSLTIKYLSDNDSAVYFCAASPHSDIERQTLIQKLVCVTLTA